MGSVLIHRLAALVLVLFGVVSLTFLLMRLSPGGPFDSERKIPPTIEAALEKKYNLDGTLWEQYASYMGGVIQGDLGLSTKY